MRNQLALTQVFRAVRDVVHTSLVGFTSAVFIALGDTGTGKTCACVSNDVSTMSILLQVHHDGWGREVSYHGAVIALAYLQAYAYTQSTLVDRTLTHLFEQRKSPDEFGVRTKPLGNVSRRSALGSNIEL